ncbi:hypothetical protein CROQUDRAFT_714416 [Cronartium quercuum f. sp. fusiforme G11]|uniref:Uncharacterized protein n=1 Tax=Cronartium quercuum f. sp. fusiforme G11 TaxID=708437 RepID=A0A9P6TDL1_9BASI|nr:hypothetical protein CROQUDRAFT_714416 [Cronartium quercuum f. sp. fusiforme G11]
MHCAILLLLLSSTLLVSAAQFLRRDAVASPVPTQNKKCFATLKNPDGHSANHIRWYPFWTPLDHDWHKSFPKGSTGPANVTLSTGKNCVVIVYVNLTDCSIDGARFNTSLTGDQLHWTYHAVWPSNADRSTTGNLHSQATGHSHSENGVEVGKPVNVGPGPPVDPEGPITPAMKANFSKGSTSRSNSTSNSHVIGPVNWVKGCSEGMKIHVAF